MKKLLFISLLFVACKKETPPATPPSNPVNPSNPNVTKTQYYDLKYFRNDTMVATWQDASGIFVYDTCYALNVGGKNYIKYKGVQYALKAYVLSNETFSDSTGEYLYDLFDMSGNYITPKDSIALGVFVMTSRNWDEDYKTWDVRRQFFYHPHKPPFPQKAVAFIGLNEY